MKTIHCLKRMCACFLVLVLVLMCAPTSVFAAPTMAEDAGVKGAVALNYLGDYDKDGEITVADALTALRIAAKLVAETPEAIEIGDTDGDGKITVADALSILRIAAKLIEPLVIGCTHNLNMVDESAPTCTEDGNIEYWVCSKCGKYFRDKEGNNEISLEDTVVPATGHTYSTEWTYDQSYHWHIATCEHSNLVSDREEHVFDSSGVCSVCGYNISVDPDSHYISYNLFDYPDNDKSAMDYMRNQQIDNSGNRASFKPTDSFNLKPVSCPGFTFNGWFTIDKVQVTRIDSSITHDMVLYASWTENTYHITYNLYGTPVEEINDKYKGYRVSTGLAEDLPNPVLKNYVFLGWYTDEGEEVTKIQPGTVGNITLNPYYTSKRNLAKRIDLSDPYLVEDIDNGVIYFAYELGTIENVPISKPVWSIESVAGLDQQVSEEKTLTVSEEMTENVVRNITKETVDSGTWTLASEWNDVTQVNEQWASEHGTNSETATENCRTESGTTSLTTSNGGSKSSSKTDGTTTLTYDSRNDSSGSSATHDVKTGGSINAEVGVDVEAGLNSGFASAKTKYSAKVGVEAHNDVTNTDQNTSGQNVHSGTDTTRIRSSTTENTSSWNNEETSSKTVEDSSNEIVKEAFSTMIANTQQYGKSYSTGGNESEARGFSDSLSESVSGSNSVTWFKGQTIKTTSTYRASEYVEGKYRLVLAGTYHVFGVVGYDVATKSFFTYTFSVLDDETYMFLDYSPKNANFDDCEYSVLPFEVPYSVYEYVQATTQFTQGLRFRTNSETKTATVFSYSGSDTEILIPSYISSGNMAYRVTGINANAFAGKNIRSIILGEYIDEIPAGAFKNCTSLEQISGYYTKIGAEAFSGCTALESYAIPRSVTEIGGNAFNGVPNVKATIISAEYARKNTNTDEYASETEAQKIERDKQLTSDILQEVISCGASSISVDLTYVVEGFEFNIEPSGMNTFELKGGRRTFSNSSINSSSNETIVREITLTGGLRTPLKSSSSRITLEVVSINCSNYSLILTYPGVKITLVKDNTIKSDNDKAIVFKNPVIESQDIDNTIGVLEVAGNIYVCGSINGIENVDQIRGNVIIISDADFSKYIKGTCVATFNGNGGSVDQNTKEVFYGSEYGALPTATRTGYTLDGWYTEATGGSRVTATSPVETVNDHTLYAHWTANKYTVTFDANGGTPATASSAISFGSTYGALPSVSRTGYAFDGWYTAKIGGTKIISTTIVENASNHTLYAHWSSNTYTVVFNANGGTGTMQNQTFTFDVANNLISNSFSLTDCAFLGWSTNSTATTATYTNGQSVMNLVSSGTVTLYAIWEKVTFDATAVLLTREPTGVTISQTSMVLVTEATGGYVSSGVLTAYVSGYSAPTKKIISTVSNSASLTWTSSNTSVATVNNSGIITAVGSGNAIITATTSKGAKAICSVTVSNSNSAITWSSNSGDVASVSSSGVVTAVKRGTATITASTNNGSKATCTVSVGETYKAIALEGTASSVTNYRASNGNYYNSRGLYIWSANKDCSVTLTFVTGDTIPDNGCLYQIASPSTDMKNTYQIYFSSGKVAVKQGQNGKSATAISEYTLSPNTKYTVVVTMNKYVSTPTGGSIVIMDENGTVLNTTQCSYSTHSGSNGASSAAIGANSSVLNGVEPNVKLLYIKLVGTQGSTGYAVETAELNIADCDIGATTMVGGNIKAIFTGTSVQKYILF